MFKCKGAKGACASKGEVRFAGVLLSSVRSKTKIIPNFVRFKECYLCPLMETNVRRKKEMSEEEKRYGNIIHKLLALPPQQGLYSLGVLLYNLVLVTNGARRGTTDFRTTFDAIIKRLQYLYSNPYTSPEDKKTVMDMYMRFLKLPRQRILEKTDVWTHDKLSPETRTKLLDDKSRDVTLGELLEYPCPRILNERKKDESEILYVIRWFPDRTNTKKWYELYSSVCPMPDKREWHEIYTKKCKDIESFLGTIMPNGGIQCLKIRE
jgi:hypothetical protein